MIFWVVDAFSEKPFSGNPAAVFLVQDFPNEILMQNIAAEVNLSETAFVKKLGENSYHIRWFTPNSEAPLCGHATIATTHILVQLGYEKNGEIIHFQSMSGELLAVLDDKLVTLNFPRYNVSPVKLQDQLRDVVEIEPIYTGFAHNCFVMEFEDSGQILKMVPDLQLLSRLECRALIVTAAGGADFEKYDFISRYFAPRVGINEDPVCASAHCRLIPYWSAKLQKSSLIAYQASKRGGVIRCQDIQTRVLISGYAVTVIKGQLC